MALKWTDSQEIALCLLEHYPAVDPKNINFVDLRNWILSLDEFEDDPKHCGERILEAVQMAWIDEFE